MIDLTEIVRDVAERFLVEAREQGSQLTLDVAGPQIGRWDRMRLEQVATNLLSNAVKYGAGTPIEVHVESAADHTGLVVRDRGIGVSAENLDRIFGRFERAVDSRQYGGLGLGLYITREIVEAHGGRIWAESEPGRGATFTVDLPREA